MFLKWKKTPKNKTSFIKKFKNIEMFLRLLSEEKSRILLCAADPLMQILGLATKSLRGYITKYLSLIFS